jgi:organic radical activating enzyme
MLEDNGYKDHLFNGAILKLTGGEPLIQQAKLLKFIDYLKQEWSFVPRIDFETNATIYPSDRWVDEFQATFTTSPKLKSNGDPKGKRYIEEVLDWHTMHNSGFKFVVQSHRDMEEIMTEYVDKFDIPTGRVWLMPCAGSREEHIRVAADVAELAKEYHFNFSPRLHLLLWDKALKV